MFTVVFSGTHAMSEVRCSSSPRYRQLGALQSPCSCVIGPRGHSRSNAGMPHLLYIFQTALCVKVTSQYTIVNENTPRWKWRRTLWSRDPTPTPSATVYKFAFRISPSKRLKVFQKHKYKGDKMSSIPLESCCGTLAGNAPIESEKAWRFPSKHLQPSLSLSSCSLWHLRSFPHYRYVWPAPVIDGRGMIFGADLLQN